MFRSILKGALCALCLTLLLLGLTTQLYGNLWQFLEGADSFFIPAESNIWRFEVTKSNAGSGSWWLYARDSSHYFALLPDSPAYLYIVRDNSCPAFDPHNHRTWCDYLMSPLPSKQDAG